MIAFAIFLIVTGAILLVLASPRKERKNIEIKYGDLTTYLPEITGFAKYPAFILGSISIIIGLVMGVLLIIRLLDDTLLFEPAPQSAAIAPDTPAPVLTVTPPEPPTTTPTFTSPPTKETIHCTENGGGGTESIAVQTPRIIGGLHIDLIRRGLESQFAGFSLWEVEIYGPETGKKNLALDAPPTASSSQDDSNCNDCSPDKAVDGKKNTRWGSEFYEPQNFEIAFPYPQVVNRIVLRWESAYAVEYCITTLEPPLPDEEILSKVNIILSETGPERVERVREWLRYDPAYQALAQMCLTVLADRRIIGNPVPLEVINGRYKSKLTYGSDDPMPLDEYNYKHLDELKTVIFKIWEERNRGPQSSFEEIVESISQAP